MTVAAGCAGKPDAQTETVPGNAATPSASSEPELALRAELDSFDAAVDAGFSVAIYEYDTGRAWSYNPEPSYLEASLVKVPILLTLLRQATEEDRGLTEDEQLLTELMISQSDNAATDELYSAVGGAEEIGRASCRERVF